MSLLRRLEKELSSPCIAGADDGKATHNAGMNVTDSRLVVNDKKAKYEKFTLEFPAHMKESQEFHFRVTVRQALDVHADYSDVFCQFK